MEIMDPFHPGHRGHGGGQRGEVDIDRRRLQQHLHRGAAEPHCLPRDEDRNAEAHCRVENRSDKPPTVHFRRGPPAPLRRRRLRRRRDDTVVALRMLRSGDRSRRTTAARPLMTVATPATRSTSRPFTVSGCPRRTAACTATRTVTMSRRIRRSPGQTGSWLGDSRTDREAVRAFAAWEPDRDEGQRERRDVGEVVTEVGEQRRRVAISPPTPSRRLRVGHSVRGRARSAWCGSLHGGRLALLLR